MAINVSSSSSNRVPAPAGNHLGRCYSVIDLGTHDNPTFGTSARKILLQFELPTELHTFREENGPEPFVVSREFTASLGKKSNLRPFLESWRGRPFTDDELKKFDVAVLAGQPCMINVLHETKNGKTYANIASVSRIPKGMDCPPAHNKTVTLSLEDEFDEAAFNSLPEWIRLKVADSPEYRRIEQHGEPTGSTGSMSSGLEEDEIPF